MKTDDLISLIAADARTEPPPAPVLALALPLTLAASMAGLVLSLGLRPDLAVALADPWVVAKGLLPLALGGVGLVLALRLARPVAAPGALPLLVAALGVLAALSLAAALVVTPAAQWARHALSPSAVVCVLTIPAMSALPLAAMLAALRRGAPVRPSRTGAVAGLAAGGLATALYSLQCTEDNPIFFVLWYGVAMALVMAAGGLAGRRLLRW